jgi:hypothetical protein
VNACGGMVSSVILIVSIFGASVTQLGASEKPSSIPKENKLPMMNQIATCYIPHGTIDLELIDKTSNFYCEILMKIECSDGMVYVFKTSDSFMKK